MNSRYLKIAWRNQWKHKGAFLINVIGLSVALAAVFFISLWVRDELSVDKFHEKDSQLYQVMEVGHANNSVAVLENTQGLLAESFVKDFPEVEKACAFFSLAQANIMVNLKTGGPNVTKSAGAIADKQFFELFSYPLLEGKPSEVMNDKNGVVVSASLAKRLYGDTRKAVGKPVEWSFMDFRATATIAGVFADIPHNSTKQFDLVITKEKIFEIIPSFKEWYNESVNSFLQLKAGTDITAFNAKIKNYLASKGQGDRFSLFVRPYSSAYLYGHYEGGIQTGGRIGYVRLFSIIGLFILIIACINFMNLATANAQTREKEIGVRKAVGSARRNLVFQFLSESVLISGIALALALLLVVALLPSFNAFASKTIQLTISPIYIAYSLGITLLASLLAGAYPAFYLSGLPVISILKGKLRASFAEILARKGLVVFQFMVSFLLIVAVMVINKQIQFIQNMNLGYNRENVISLTREGQLLTNTPAFLNRLKALPEVKNAATLNGAMAEPNAVNTTSGVFWEGKPDNQEVNFSVKMMDYDLIETLGMEMAQGRAFSRKFGDEKSSLVLNETAIKTMGLKDPIGKKISMWGEDKIIVGIVKDFLDNSIHEEIRPVIMRFDPTATTSIVVKIAAGKERAALAAIESIYKEMNPGYTFEYRFIDQQYQSLYAAEQRITVLSQIFAGIAIVISCLGLLGLVSFMAERRAKEIGIRKVLGASITGIVRLLAQDFLQLVLIAILIASPLAWYFMNQWLAGFAYQVELNAWMFVAAGVVAVLIAFLTISFQSIKAALANPVKSLRSE